MWLCHSNRLVWAKVIEVPGLGFCTCIFIGIWYVHKSYSYILNSIELYTNQGVIPPFIRSSYNSTYLKNVHSKFYRYCKRKNQTRVPEVSLPGLNEKEKHAMIPTKNLIHIEVFDDFYMPFKKNRLLSLRTAVERT